MRRDNIRVAEIVRSQPPRDRKEAPQRQPQVAGAAEDSRVAPGITSGTLQPFKTVLLSNQGFFEGEVFMDTSI